MAAIGLLDHPEAGQENLNLGVEVGQGTRLGHMFSATLVKTCQMYVYTSGQTLSPFPDGPDGSHPPTGTRSMPHTRPSLHLPEAC
jgi:hypothetical protein